MVKVGGTEGERGEAEREKGMVKRDLERQEVMRGEKS